MVVKSPEKMQRRSDRDKTFDSTIFKDGDFDEEDEDETEDEDEDEDDVEEIKDDDDYDKDLVRIIRNSYPKQDFLRWLASKRIRKS